MFAIAVISGVMAFIIFGFIIGILIIGTPYPKTGLAFATVGFLLVGGIFVATALNTEVPCDYGSQRVALGETSACVQDHEVVELLESRK